MTDLDEEAEMASVEVPESSDTMQRRERAAIAAQACQTCRSRKSKCDEQRPKCRYSHHRVNDRSSDGQVGGLCRRLNTECIYREPLPTKKDKTMVHILEVLSRLENKFDSLSLSRVPSFAPAQISDDIRTPPSQSIPSTAVWHSPNDPESETPQPSFDLQQGHSRSTIPHKIILWPSIYIDLINSGISAASDLQFVLQEGTSWLIRLEMTRRKATLPTDEGLSGFLVGEARPERSGRARFAFASLTAQRIEELSGSYFSTFHALSPLFIRKDFMSDVIRPIVEHGFAEGDVNTVLALLVLALGQVALDGIFERPVSFEEGVASGFRGGTVESPPGLDIFNEARKRVGFFMTAMTLQAVQAHLLLATYYGSCANHLDFWHSTVTAAMTCQVLIKCQAIDWQTDYGDLIQRAYWACVLNETFYHVDLDLPQSGIYVLEDVVPLPFFSEGSSEVPGMLYQYHFLAMITLRRLISRIDETIHGAVFAQPETTVDYSGPPVKVIREMARQLESWRSLLPRPFQWQDSDRLNFPILDPATRMPSESMFSPDQGPVPISHKHNLDIITAQIRTRFYYARFIIYRPFVYKALHFPELMTSEDRSYCGLAIKAALLWPISLAPPKNKKRLVPHLFAWTQNFLGILLILRMTAVNECLQSICEEYVNREELQTAVELMLAWVKDVRQLDSVADWAWKILQPLFHDKS